MLNAMHSLIARLDLLPRGCHVLCAVSGGADSVALLHALYQLRPRLGFSLSAAHYDHRLRGEDSRRDAQFVEQFVRLCCGPQRLADGRVLPAVPLYSGSGDVAGAAARQGRGVEETARTMRYAFLRATARTVGADRIATAHHADDNAETILFHLARGSGLRGLTGIAPQGAGLIRPLLTTPRKEIESYLAYYGLPHREDASNRDDRYARNRLRHQVTPVLDELFPGFAPRLADTAARLRADEDCLAQLGADLAARAVAKDGGWSIPAAALAEAPEPIALRAVQQLLARLRGDGRDCAAAHWAALLRLCRTEDPSARLSLPHGLTARREYEALLLVPAREDAPLSPAVLPLPGQVTWGEWTVTAAPVRYLGQPQGTLDFYLSQQAAPALTLRPRRTGDRLAPPGRPGKSLKRRLIDEKIPRDRRDRLPVLDAAGQVAAAALLGPDAAFVPPPGADAWHIRLIPPDGTHPSE